MRGKLKLTKYFRNKMQQNEMIQLKIDQLKQQNSEISDLISEFKNRIKEVDTLKYYFLLLSFH